MDISTRIISILPEMSMDDKERFKNNLFIVLNDYQISPRTTEIAITDSGKTEKAVRMFFISKKVEGCADTTIKYYETVLHRFFEIAPRNLDEINSDTVRYYIATRSIKDGLSKVSQDNELRILRSFFKYCSSENYIQKSPTDAIKAVKKEKRIKKAIQERDLERLRNSAKTIRDKAIIDVLYSTGARVSELVAMNRSDLEGDEIIVFGKGSKERIVYINARTQVSLKDYIDSRDDCSDALFVTQRRPHKRITKGGVERMLRELGESIGVPNIHPHRFRRTMATNALNRGMPIEEVQRLLGHSEIGTTTIYARSTNENIKADHRKYIV